MRKWQTILRFQIHFLSLIYIRVKIIGDICCECLFLTFCKGLSDEKRTLLMNYSTVFS